MEPSVWMRRIFPERFEVTRALLGVTALLPELAYRWPSESKARSPPLWLPPSDGMLSMSTSLWRPSLCSKKKLMPHYWHSRSKKAKSVSLYCVWKSRRG